MSFKDSKLAHDLLDGLTGIEIGGAAHNQFHLNTINVDRGGDRSTWVEHQNNLAGSVMPVDVVANGDDLPFSDKSFDFVLSSHVFEHFKNPLKALFEWERVAQRYIFMIIPHAHRTRETTPLATVDAINIAYDSDTLNDEDRHHYGYLPETMREILISYGYVFEIYEPDDKVGNGFTVVIKLD